MDALHSLAAAPLLACAALLAQEEAAPAASAPQEEEVQPVQVPRTAAPFHGSDDEARARYFSSPPMEPGVSPVELLHRPLIVNGERIPIEDMKRFLVFGPGSLLLESRKFAIIMKNELAARGLTPEQIEEYQVTDEELEKEIARQREQFENDYPTLDFKTEVRRAHRDYDLWTVQLRQTMNFDKIFIPDNPDEWPAVTTAAVIDESGGNTFFVDDAKEVYESRRQRMEEQGLDELPPYPLMYLDILRSMVLDSLHKFSLIEYFPERLPEGAVLTVDGTPVELEDVYQWLEPYLTWEDVQNARYWAVKTHLLARDLERTGDLMDGPTYEQYWSDKAAQELYENQRSLFIRKLPDEDEAVRAAKIKDWEENYHRESYTYQQLLFARQMLALQAEGFPSTWAYGEYNRLMESYRKRIADELDDARTLESIRDRVTKIVSVSKIDCESILVSAFDWDHFRWKDGDCWEAARQKAFDLKRRLDAGEPWNQILEMESEYWDPPQPEVSPQKPIFGFKFKGRWGEQTRNNFRAKVGDSEFRIFLYGDAVSDYAFFNLGLNKVGGPLRGPQGYVLFRVNRRTPPQRQLDLNEPRHWKILQGFWLRYRFLDYGRDLMAAAKIWGLDGPVPEGVEIPEDPSLSQD